MASNAEAGTCRKYVLPKLYAAGWTGDQINEQRSFHEIRVRSSDAASATGNCMMCQPRFVTCLRYEPRFSAASPKPHLPPVRRLPELASGMAQANQGTARRFGYFVALCGFCLHSSRTTHARNSFGGRARFLAALGLTDPHLPHRSRVRAACRETSH
jgi:hypothetical protein